MNVLTPVTLKQRFIVIALPRRRFFRGWTRPRMVVLAYVSPEETYDEHLSDFEKWWATFQVTP